eukprot:ANDGO_00469.mRNA.1 Cytosolic purine 5'-nucleotidase
MEPTYSRSDFSEVGSDVSSGDDELVASIRNQLEHAQKHRPVRCIGDRIFTNRSLRMDSVRAIGFDMDYTLAVYRPKLDSVAYAMTLQRVIKKGYPAELESLQFDPSLPNRGIILDKSTGCMLRTDQFGHILSCARVSSAPMEKSEWRKLYPSSEINPHLIGSRYYAYDTLFGLPEQCMFMQIAEVLAKADVEVSYYNLFEDIRNSMDSLHWDGSLKSIILANPQEYIVSEPEKYQRLFTHMREAGKVIFLLTNSDYPYSNGVLSFLFGTPNWRQFFDIAIVSASKPNFFNLGTTLREVDIETGNLRLSQVSETFKPGAIYSGGNIGEFMKRLGVPGYSVLYVGDNLSHDLISNRSAFSEWRTMYIVPEIEHEDRVFRSCIPDLRRAIHFESLVRETEDALGRDSEELVTLRNRTRELVRGVELKFNRLHGSIFRSGSSKLTFFAYSVQRFADIYGCSVLSLLKYDLSSVFFMGNSKRVVHEPWDWNSNFLE